MEKTITHTLEMVRIPRGDVTEFYIHGQKNTLTCESEILDDLFSFLSTNNAVPAAFRIFAADAVRQQILQRYASVFSHLVCPVTWISQNESGAFSIQVQAFSGARVERVKWQDAAVGCRYADEDAEYFQLSFMPDDLSAAHSQQAAAAFHKCRDILSDCGLDFTNVARTWLFAHDILAWYDKLNLARNDFFTRYDIFSTTVPASTGVGLANSAGAKLAFESFAVHPRNSHVQIQKVDSPLQCAALDYRSSFNRAILIQTRRLRRVLVSGTASIDAKGNTVFLNDTAKQIDKTMQVTRALLNTVNMDWPNIVRGIMYFKDAGQFDLFDAWCRTHHVAMPHIKVHADICRPDLLFELEIDAIAL